MERPLHRYKAKVLHYSQSKKDAILSVKS